MKKFLAFGISCILLVSCTKEYITNEYYESPNKNVIERVYSIDFQQDLFNDIYFYGLKEAVNNFQKEYKVLLKDSPEYITTIVLKGSPVFSNYEVLNIVDYHVFGNVVLTFELSWEEPDGKHSARFENFVMPVETYLMRSYNNAHRLDISKLCYILPSYGLKLERL